MAVAAPSRVCDSGARELQPLIERRILFHPAKDATLASGISALPPGIEPLNRGFDAARAPAPAPAPAGPENSAAAASFSPISKGTKRSWQEANAAGQAPLRIGAGLSNLGNTCFLNAVLQCLTYTQPLASYLQSGQHKASCRRSGFCALCALEVHVNDALQSRGKVISPNYIVKNLRSISRSFQPWRQEDAHEYLRYLMEALQKSCLPNKTPSNSPEQEKTFMHNFFCGRLRSEVKCTVCLQRSETLEPFWDLSLDITRADSLGKALAWFTANEILDGENKYNCSKCKKKVRAIKRFTIESAPSILTVQFKRFSSAGMHGQKIDKKVHFGRSLDISPFMSNARDGAVYDLYGVLVHSGHSTHSGHYYCFVRTSGDLWHHLDDSRVKQLSEQNVLDKKAYILFYTRKQMKRSEPSAVPASKSAIDQVSIPAMFSLASKKIAAEAPAAALSKAPEPEAAPPLTKAPEPQPGARAEDQSAKIPADKAPVSLPESAAPAKKINPPAPEVSSPIPTEAAAPEPEKNTLRGQEARRVDAPEAAPVEISDKTPAGSVENAVAGSTAPVEAPADVEVSPPAPVDGIAEPVFVNSLAPCTETPSAPTLAPGERTGTDEASASVQEIEQEDPAENSFPGVSKHSRVSGKTPRGESPRRFMSPRKSSESPRKAYLKLLRAMPKKRRVFLARALELEQVIERPELKRRRPAGSSEFSPKPEAEVAGNESLAPAAPTKQSSGASKPVSSSSELFGSGVARWDDVDAKDIDRLLRTEHKVPTKRPDDWDEEYDRGKVKKVRRVAVGGRLTPCKNSEAGQSSNPFQVLANKHKK